MINEIFKKIDEKMWTQFRVLLQEFDESIERFIQAIIDDLERTYRNEMEEKTQT